MDSLSTLSYPKLTKIYQNLYMMDSNVLLHWIQFRSTGNGLQMTEKKTTRTYPPFYERFIPIAIGLLALVIIGMLAFTIAIGVGALKFG